MAAINFYLKDKKAKTETPIYLFFSFDNQRLKYGVGKSILPKHWNTETQRAREKKEVLNHAPINALLKKLSNQVEDEYLKAKGKGVRVTPTYLRTQLDQFLYKNQTIEKDFFGYLNEFINVQTAIKKKRTIQKYKTLERHLLDFQKAKRIKISFDTLDMGFYEKYMAYYVQELGLLNNTINKYFTTLKTFLNWATERKYNTNLTYIKFKAPSNSADIIYLTQDELTKIYTLDLSNNKRLEQVRDAFCFACYTGLRHSDTATIKKANVKADKIIMTSYKTREQLNIPLNDFAKEILEKYEYRLPVISNQKFNEYIKEVGALAEINEPVILTKYSGAEVIKFEKPKWQFLSSHCGRRTFVTLSLEKGMRAETVMSITGHKNYITFKKYIKITDMVKMVEMKTVWKREEPLKPFKVA